MKMVLLIASLCAFPAAAQEEPIIAQFSFQDTSCGAWTKSAGDIGVRAQYASWFRGFVSGYNFARPDNQVVLEKMPDPDTLALFVDKYCRENPLMPFTSSAMDLVRQLRDHSDPPMAKSRRPR